MCIRDSVKRRLEDLDRMLDEARAIAGEADGPFMYDEMLEKDQMLLQKLLEDVYKRQAHCFTMQRCRWTVNREREPKFRFSSR